MVALCDNGNGVSTFRFTTLMSTHSHLSTSVTLPRPVLAHEDRPWFRRVGNDV